MSITIRLWSAEELQKIKSGENDYLATIFLNKNGFSLEEMPILLALRTRTRKKVRTFRVTFRNHESESIEVLAVSMKTLYAFLQLEYLPGSIIRVEEKFIRYKLMYSEKENK